MEFDDISKTDCGKLAKKIREDIFKPSNSFKTTVFLCGADISKKDKIRYRIAEVFSDFLYEMEYELIYPEDIFHDLLYSSTSADLLSLENLLADSVDAIIIIPESPGSFAELGAFANSEKLRSKLVCVVDVKYKKDKSFINQGPLKLVKKVNPNGVIFIDPNEIGKLGHKGIFTFFSDDKEMNKITSAIRRIKKNSTKLENKINLLQLGNFLLPTIYLLEPVSKRTLINITEYAIEDEVNAFHSTTTALSMLTKKRQVELTSSGYKLTTLGLNDFLGPYKKSGRIKRQDETNALDEVRLEILNLKYRNKKLKVG